MCFNRKKIIQRAIHHTRREIVYPNLTSVKSVGYFFSGEHIEQESYWKKAVTPVNIQYLCFLEGKRGTDTRSDVIYQSDLNFLKLPPDKLIRNFTEKQFDILINMAGSGNEALTYIGATSKAKFKVCYVPYDRLYDLVVDLNETNKHTLSAEVIKTLQNLKSK
jgi:hypothetical protein